MNNSMNLYKDVLIGVFYLTGVAGLMYGEVLLSAALIGSASLISNFHFR